ncbi:MAG: PIG-L family deacetylase, partial [Planctomycetaceae bacterium]|nr:PIG-L family deacetylase [Planctomycetaceae bacterium]
LTDGEPTPRSPGPEVRLEEARKAAEILGVQVRETLDLPNRRLFDGFDERVALAKVFRRYRPRLVIGLAGKTPLASPDHWQASQITDAAIFYSRLSKWDDIFDHLPVHTIPRQLWYPLGVRRAPETEQGNAFVSNISEQLDLKLQSVRAYETQFPAEKAHVIEMIEGLNRHAGATAGFAAGEVLITPFAVGISDLMSTLFF